jgi:hypothetical protein
MKDKQMGNPLLGVWNTAFGLPPFGQIKDSDFAPAFEMALAQARARVAEKTAAIASVLAARAPQADECKRCRFEFGRTSVLRPMPSKSKVARFQCALCGHEEERV